jgi:hypothetical protein
MLSLGGALWKQGMLEGYLMAAAQQSNLFAHILIWQLQVQLQAQLPAQKIILIVFLSLIFCIK